MAKQLSLRQEARQRGVTVYQVRKEREAPALRKGSFFRVDAEGGGELVTTQMRLSSRRAAGRYMETVRKLVDERITPEEFRRRTRGHQVMGRKVVSDPDVALALNESMQDEGETTARDLFTEAWEAA